MVGSVPQCMGLVVAGYLISCPPELPAQMRTVLLCHRDGLPVVIRVIIAALADLELDVRMRVIVVAALGTGTSAPAGTVIRQGLGDNDILVLS